MTETDSKPPFENGIKVTRKDEDRTNSEVVFEINLKDDTTNVIWRWIRELCLRTIFEDEVDIEV